MCIVNAPFFTHTQQGWQCPSCHRCYSPSTPQCFSCPPKVTIQPFTNSPTITWEPNIAITPGTGFTVPIDKTTDPQAGV